MLYTTRFKHFCTFLFRTGTVTVKKRNLWDQMWKVSDFKFSLLILIHLVVFILGDFHFVNCRASDVFSLFVCLFVCLLAGSSQFSLKMRIKLGKQSVEKAKIEMGAVVSSNLFLSCTLFCLSSRRRTIKRRSRLTTLLPNNL